MGQAVISTDVAVLGVHLDVELFPLEDLGFKAVAAAVSDLAAMGARVRGAVVAVTAPPGTDLEELHRGMADASIVTNCPIVGGDLAQGRDVSVAVTVVGECPGRGVVYRSDAKVGDDILVTGPLGRLANAGFDGIARRASRVSVGVGPPTRGAYGLAEEASARSPHTATRSRGMAHVSLRPPSLR